MTSLSIARICLSYQDKILFVARTHPSEYSGMELPGGKIEPTHTPWLTMLMELHQEAGLAAKLHPYSIVVHTIEEREYHIGFAHADLYCQHAQHEHDYRWVQPTRIMDLQLTPDTTTLMKDVILPIQDYLFA